MKKLLFVSRQAPYGNSLPREALDAVLAASAYEQDISYLFMNDGVFQLLKQQDPTEIGLKNLSATLQALELYGVDKIFACKESLQQRGLNQADLCMNVQVMERSALQSLLHSQDKILSF
ncbi:MAG: sulfurtransferase complex subunit TusC [Cellvibrionaceae bacterium]